MTITNADIIALQEGMRFISRSILVEAVVVLLWTTPYFLKIFFRSDDSDDDC